MDQAEGPSLGPRPQEHYTRSDREGEAGEAPAEPGPSSGPLLGGLLGIGRPHSGQRSGVARRSYPQRTHKPVRRRYFSSSPRYAPHVESNPAAIAGIPEPNRAIPPISADESGSTARAQA